MKHNPEIQKQYFQFAYQTGSDIWSHIPYRSIAHSMIPTLEKDDLVLDIGAGRGLWALDLVEKGYRVLGLDYAESIVEKVNQKILQNGYSERARFMVGNATSIPFVDQGFHMATDIGTLQHITSEQWHAYATEVSRVLIAGGYYLNISLSRKTKKFLGFHPRESIDGDFTKFGVHYHFFTRQEIATIFGDKFIAIDQRFESYDSHSDPGDKLTLVFTLMQKK